MMKFLFIESIQFGNWDELIVKCSIVIICWALVIIAVLLDLWAGIDRAKAVGEKPRSDKFRRTIEKIGDYWRVLAFGLILDIIGSILPFYNLAYASLLASVACILIELKSVVENLRAKKSVAAQLPEIIKEIMRCKDIPRAIELIGQVQNLNNNENNTIKGQSNQPVRGQDTPDYEG
jgi:hypothetical protein